MEPKIKNKFLKEIRKAQLRSRKHLVEYQNWNRNQTISNELNIYIFSQHNYKLQFKI